MKKICKECRKEFHVFESHSKRKYCSQECYWETLRGKPTWNKGKKLPNNTGENHPTWKRSGVMRNDGYVVKTSDGVRNLEHRLVMEKHLGRKLERNETVHHLDGDRTNNRLSNLEIMSNSDHVKLHLKERWNK